MSDYNPIYVYQRRDYEANRLAMKKYWEKQAKLKAEGKSVWEWMQTKLPKAILITEVRPNPLSMELRIVFGLLWNTYTDCLLCACTAQESKTGSFGGGTAANYERDAKEAVAYAYLLCHDLFDVTSPHAPVHIHSEHGCCDETCPAWVRGRQAAMDNVHDWYTPDC